MATWLALTGFLALIGLPVWLMWGMPGIFRHHDAGGDAGSAGGAVGYDNAPSSFTDSGGGDAGGGGGGGDS